MHPQLTQSLYLKDEVIAMLITSILELRPVSECLFWFWELSTSTDLVDGVWVIYMLFFSTRDHSLECYVRSKIAEYKQNDLNAHKGRAHKNELLLHDDEAQH